MAPIAAPMPAYAAVPTTTPTTLQPPVGLSAMVEPRIESGNPMMAPVNAPRFARPLEISTVSMSAAGIDRESPPTRITS
jgi:hypothetical protein